MIPRREVFPSPPGDALSYGSIFPYSSPYSGKISPRPYKKSR